MSCGATHHISVLLTGFAMETQPLTAALDHMRNQLAHVRNDVLRMHALSLRSPTPSGACSGS
jgi:hypothetical protein